MSHTAFSHIPEFNSTSFLILSSPISPICRTPPFPTSRNLVRQLFQFLYICDRWGYADDHSTVRNSYSTGAVSEIDAGRIKGAEGRGGGEGGGREKKKGNSYSTRAVSEIDAGGTKGAEGRGEGGRGGAGGVGERLRSRLLMKTCHTGSFNRLTALAYLAVGLLGDTSVGLLRLCHLLAPPFPPPSLWIPCWPTLPWASFEAAAPSKKI